MKTVLLAIEDRVAFQTLSSLCGDPRKTRVFAARCDEAIQHLRGEHLFSDRKQYPVPHAILCDPPCLQRIVASCKDLHPSPRIYLLTNPAKTETVIQMMAQALR
jgi:hypothetical protein